MGAAQNVPQTKHQAFYGLPKPNRQWLSKGLSCDNLPKNTQDTTTPAIKPTVNAQWLFLYIYILTIIWKLSVFKTLLSCPCFNYLSLILQMPHYVSLLAPYRPCGSGHQTCLVVTQLGAFLSQPEDLFASKLLKRAHPADWPLRQTCQARLTPGISLVVGLQI